MTTREQLVSIPFGAAMLITPEERPKLIQLAERMRIGIITAKLDGVGLILIKVKNRPIQNCPKCGHQRHKPKRVDNGDNQGEDARE